MFPISHFNIRLEFAIISTSLLIIAIVILSNSPKLYGTNQIDFYSIDSPPPGVKSLEPLIGKWWNWWVDRPTSMAGDWPECVIGDGGVIGNQSLIFTANPAWAPKGEGNFNATNQNCQISSHQLLYLTVYPGECSTILGSNPREGEFEDINSVDGLLKCAQDVNREIKKMQVKVDGEDVSSHIIRQTTSQPFNLIVKPENSEGWEGAIVGGNNTSMAENYYLLFKPLPVGDHQIELEVVRDPPGPPLPENPFAKWNFKVVP